MPIARERVLEAVKKAREQAGKRKFVQSIDLMLGFKGLDLNKPENRITVEVPLPHGTGKSLKVLMFAEGELARRAKEAGADLVMGQKEIETLAGDRKKAKEIVEAHDAFLAQADMMPLIGKQLGPVLAPRGKMPKPVPLSADPKPLIERSRGIARINVRTQPVVHMLVGREDMSDDQLADNIEAILRAVESRLPRGLRQLKSVYLKTTMGKPVRIEV